MASPEGSSQWIFPIAALEQTPTALERSLEEEMYNRNRGIEFLFRLGTSIALYVVERLRYLCQECLSLLATKRPSSLPPPGFIGFSCATLWKITIDKWALSLSRDLCFYDLR